MIESKNIRIVATVIIVVGLLFTLAGAATWLTVRSALADEHITVSQDATSLAGKAVIGPLTAYAQANVIKGHALTATGGKTYAELDREDPVRQTAMTASFLRASLFTSVVAFGVAAMSIGLGLVLLLIGFALLKLSAGRVNNPMRAPASA
ncbi:MAG TPA: aromatic ring-opening dioxygenase LigA [Acidimicrobiia bacterium]|nr:aromatic ring-opening dioxygenase LigA [Acidimicrobiia bacterium]